MLLLKPSFLALLALSHALPAEIPQHPKVVMFDLPSADELPGYEAPTLPSPVAPPAEVPQISTEDKLASMVDTTLSCIYSKHALYFTYVVAGEGWVGMDDEVYKKIKKAAKKTGAVTSWDQRDYSGRGSVEVEFKLPLGTNKKLTKNLNKRIVMASGRSVKCVKVSKGETASDVVVPRKFV